VSPKAATPELGQEHAVEMRTKEEVMEKTELAWRDAALAWEEFKSRAKISEAENLGWHMGSLATLRWLLGEAWDTEIDYSHLEELAERIFAEWENET